MSRQFNFLPVLAVFLLAASSANVLGVDQATHEWLRGSGKDLQIRLQGEAFDADGQRATDVKVVCGMYSAYPVPTLAPTLDGNQFEIWLPVNSAKQYSMWLMAASTANKQVAYKQLNAYDLRQAAIDGIQLTLQTPTQRKSFWVQDQGQPVAQATVKIELGYGIELRAVTGTDGIAHFDLLSDQQISQVTAWTNDYRIGGFSFGRQPTHDPNDDEFVVELSKCRDQRMRFVDQEGSPVPGIEFNLQVATPSPNYNFLGANEHSRIRTDDTGEVVYRWFPDWKAHFFYADLLSLGWILVGDAEGGPEKVGDAYVFKLKRSQERKAISGRVVSTNSDVGGFYVTLQSFQSERDNHVDSLSTFTDEAGNFSVDVLPDARYCAWVLDARWVGNIIDLIPYSPSLNQVNSPELSVSDGQEVRVVATLGADNEPYANLGISFRREHDFQWQENGKTRQGSGGPQWWIKTDDTGRATTRTLPGKLKVSVYTPKWRSEQTVEVRDHEPTQVSLHRETTDRTTVHGQLVLADGLQVPLQDVAIHAAAVDGNYNDEQHPTPNSDGSFEFETLASAVGIFASTKDGKAAGSTIATDLDTPVKLKLRPTMTYEGQLLGDDDQPLVGHRIFASVSVQNDIDYDAPFPKDLTAKHIDTRTDEHGNFTLLDVPSQIPVTIYADALEGSDDNQWIDEVLLQPNESRPRTVSRLKSSSSSADDSPLSERYAATLRDCKLGGYLPLLILASGGAPTAEFVQDNFIDYEKNPEVSGFMQISVDCSEDALNADDTAFLKQHHWQLPDKWHVTAHAIDTGGQELGQLELDIRDENSITAAFDFIRRHAPPQLDAEEKWAHAFAEAKRSNRRVLARISQRYCGPCFALSRWLDDRHEFIDKDYVLLKIDNVRDLNGAAVAERLTHGKHYGVPFYAIFDQDENLLIDSAGPLGNIGYPGDRIESKRHLRKMLLDTRHNLSDAEIDQLIDSVRN